MDQFPQDDDMLNVFYEIDHFAFLLLKRLTTSYENEVLPMSQNVFTDIIICIIFFNFSTTACHLIICGICYIITVL